MVGREMSYGLGEREFAEGEGAEGIFLGVGGVMRVRVGEGLGESLGPSLGGFAEDEEVAVGFFEKVDDGFVILIGGEDVEGGE